MNLEENYIVNEDSNCFECELKEKLICRFEKE